MASRGATPLNVVRNMLRPGYARVVAGKVWRRFGSGGDERGRATEWAAARRVVPKTLLEPLDPDLWAEANEFGRGLRERAERVGRELGVDLGYAGRYEVLYFLTRLRRPRVVVETGVAFGYSSTAFLSALERNGEGRLWSSDFPYFRARDPERYVGALVPEELRHRWSLRTAGDAKNLPEILAECGEIDLFHYDSDKTAAGRRLAVDLVTPRLAPGALVLMDDIQDNLFFRDWVEDGELDYTVLGHRDFFVGAIGL